MGAEHQKGHRSRLRARFMKAGLRGIADYELLELVLFAAYPRGDVKPLAKELLAHFKTFTGVIHASEIELLRIKGIGPAAVATLKIAGAFGEKLLQEGLQRGPVNSNLEKVVDYCRLAMEHLREEQLRLLFLDKKYQLIADEVQQTGTVDHTPVYPREVIKRALELGASGIILVHNHPTGDPTPSRADVEVTKEIQEACVKLGIEVHDHIIIGKKEHISFRAKGLIRAA